MDVLDQCRICLEPTGPGDIGLGCACKNELAVAHLACAQRWFEGRDTCEICNQPLGQGALFPVPPVPVHAALPPIPHGPLQVLVEQGRPGSHPVEHYAKRGIVGIVAGGATIALATGTGMSSIVVATALTMTAVGFFVECFDPVMCCLFNVDFARLAYSMRIFHCISLPSIAALLGFFMFAYRNAPWWYVMPLGCSTAMADVGLLGIVMMLARLPTLVAGGAPAIAQP